MSGLRLAGPVLAALVAAGAAPAQEILVSNFHTISSSGFGVREDNWKAAGFVNDGQERGLASITVKIGPPLPGIISELWAGDDEPTTHIADLEEGPLAPINTFIWEPVDAVTLAPNDTYWMVLAYPDGSLPDTTSWLNTLDGSTTGSGSLVPPLISLTDGATWQLLSGNIQMRLQIEVAVPEPSGRTAACVALVAVALVRRARSGLVPPGGQQ